jgi:hypothetical protein
VNHLSEGSATELQANLPLYDSSLFKQILAKLPLIAVKTIFDFDQAFSIGRSAKLTQAQYQAQLPALWWACIPQK